MGRGPHDQGGVLQVAASSHCALPDASERRPWPGRGAGPLLLRAESPIGSGTPVARLDASSPTGACGSWLRRSWRSAMVVLFPTVYLFWMSVTHWVVTDPGRYFGGTENFRELFGCERFLGRGAGHAHLSRPLERADGRARPRPGARPFRDALGGAAPRPRRHAADHSAGGRGVHLALPPQRRDGLHRRVPSPLGRLHAQPARRSGLRAGLGGDRRRLEPHALHVPDLPRRAAEHPERLLRGRQGRRRQHLAAVPLRDAADDDRAPSSSPSSSASSMRSTPSS